MESQTNQIESSIDFQIHKWGSNLFKLQIGDSNPRPPAKPSSDTMVNNQLFEKLKLIGFGFNMNIMLQEPSLVVIQHSVDHLLYNHVNVYQNGSP